MLSASNQRTHKSLCTGNIGGFSMIVPHVQIAEAIFNISENKKTRMKLILIGFSHRIISGCRPYQSEKVNNGETRT